MKGFLTATFIFIAYIACAQQCFTGTINLIVTPSATTNEVTLNWNPVSDAGGWDQYYPRFYFVHYGVGNLGTQLLPGTSGTTATIPGLTFGATYSFQINVSQTCLMNDGSGLTGQDLNIPTSNIATATIIPAVPTIVGGVSNSSTSITCNWNSVNGAIDYAVEITNGAGTVVQNPGNVAGTSYIAQGLSANTNYFFRVRARNNAGSSVSYSTKSAAILTFPVAPTFPATSATAITTTSFKASWLAVAGATSYLFEASADQNFGSFVTNPSPLVINGTITPDIAGLTGGTTYYYRVRAVNSLGGTSANSVRKDVLTAPVAPTGFNVASTTSNSMSANWTATPTSTVYELTVATDQNFNFPIPSYNPKIINTPTISDAVSNLSASTTYYLRLRAKNGTASYSDYAYTSAATKPLGGGGGLTLTPSFTSTHTPGEAQDIAVDVAGATPPVSITLYHRKNSEANYATVNVPLANGSTYKIAINDAWLDAFGMEFYLSATDANNPIVEKKDAEGKPFKIRSGIANVTAPLSSFGNSVKNYQVISFPYLITDRPQVKDVFEFVMGDYDKKQWRLFQYKDGKTEEYSEGVSASTIEQGKAYWFITKNEVDLSFGKGKSYGNALSDAAPFKIALVKGWNQIGNPYPHDLGWPDIQLANPLIGKLDVFDNATGSFAESDLLKAFSGGFVFADNATDLVFPITLPNKGGRKATPSSDGFSETNGWSLPIQLSQGEIINTRSGIGMLSAAVEGKDKFDNVTPPRFFRYLELNSRKSNYDFDLSRDIVNPTDNYTWNFNVESNSSEPVELTWSNQTVATLEAQLILYDHTKQVLLDMAKLNTYSTVSGATLSIHFRKLHQLDVAQLELGKPYPNPFQTEITLPYFYSIGEHVQAIFTVHDLAGKIVVQKNITTTSDQSGIQNIQWDGITTSGNPAGSGLYFFNVRVNQGKETLNFNGKIIKQ